MAQIVRVQAKALLQWRAERTEPAGRWVAVCPAMNLTTEADTLDELHSIISETIQLVLVDLLRDNELQKFLRERGWKAQVPAQVDPEDIHFNVPWQLVAKGGHDPARRTN